MAKCKILIGDKGKTYTKEVSDDQASSLIGLKLGATLKGDLIGLGGYELLITGGSDSGGFPMRKGFHGSSSRQLILSAGVGLNSTVKGIRKKKRVRGDTISESIVQINTKILTSGPTALDKLLAPVEEAPEGGDASSEAPAEKPAEKPAKEPKQEKKEEAPKEEKKPEKPAEPPNEEKREESKS